MKIKLKQSIEKKFLNVDGTINKTIVASFITLALLLIQQIMVACGFSYGHWDQIAGNGDVTAPTEGGKVNETQTTQTK